MLRAGELATESELKRRFAEAPPLTSDEALFEASRCLYCFDAPCTRACPTGIDVPRFIRQILHRDELSAARTILEANIFGGSCARVCPTEVLCEGACVDRVLSGGPIPIGQLQRMACDSAVDQGENFFLPGPPTGKKVAVVGAGPAGLTCAHELRKFGHEVVVFEAKSYPGGLDTSGVAAYKVSTDFVSDEIGRILSIGIDLRLNHPVDARQLSQFLDEFDAVFLGVGLGRTGSLRIEGEELENVVEALEFIEQTRLQPFIDCKIGREVVVIGGGNTAIDVATAAKRLGADRVTIAYRKGPAEMPAFAFEYELAKQDGVRFEWYVTPIRIIGEAGSVQCVEFARTFLGDQGILEVVPGSQFSIAADLVVKALGQEPMTDWVGQLSMINHANGRIFVDPITSETTAPGVFAGGDYLRKGGEVVDAVQDGKRAALGIHAYLGRS